MTIGYDKPRPSSAQYHKFVEQIDKGLAGYGKEGLGLTLYGSYVREDYIPGESDIDAVLVFPDNVVTDKKRFRDISIILANAAKESGFPMEELFQICPIDVGLARDGRFNSLTGEFADYFKLERKVLFGPDYTVQFSYEDAKAGDVAAISHNLRKTRQSLLFSTYTQEEDMPMFIKGFHATLKAASRASKQILHIADGELRRNRFSALRELQRTFPEVNIEPLKVMKKLYTNPREMDTIYQRPQEALNYWYGFMTFFEDVVRAYIEKFPRDKKK